MSKFHSTVSRRDFMKGLGLGAAGLGAAAATAPVFHDLDEMTSQHQGLKRPWYVNELDYGNTTVEIDWGMMQRRTGNFMDPYGGGKIYKEELLKKSTNPAAVASRASGIGVKS